MLILLISSGVIAGDNNCVDCVPAGVWNCLGGLGAGAETCTINSSGSCTVTGICGDSGGGCFLAGTDIMTVSGLVGIEDLVPGDKVLTKDATGKTIQETITNTYKVIVFDFLEINGDLQVTGTHPFMVADGWKTAGELEVGDEIVSENGQMVLVSSIEPHNKGVRAYNLTVGGSHTFYAGGYFVHNKDDPIQNF